MGGYVTLRAHVFVVIALIAGAGREALAEPAAWRLTSPSGGEVVLLGSVHVLRDSDYPLPASVVNHYARADRVVMELDLDDLDPAEIQSELLRAAVLPPGTTLADVIGSALYESAQSRARSLGIDIALLERLEPWLVAVTMLDLGMNQLGYRADRGLEQYLLGLAARDGKEILGIESLAVQTAVFDSLTLAQQSSLLAQTLTELGSAEDMMDELIAAWAAGSLDELTDALLDEFEDFPELYQSLVIDRNVAWIDEIENLLADNERTLIVVGGLHLVGDDSVIELLRERGHTVDLISGTP